MTCMGHSGAEHTKVNRIGLKTQDLRQQEGRSDSRSHTPDLNCPLQVWRPGATAPSSPGRPEHCPPPRVPEPKRRDIRSQPRREARRREAPSSSELPINVATEPG